MSSQAQNWITAYTPEDVDYVLNWYGKSSDKSICDHLNITILTLKEIVNTNHHQ